MVLELVGWLAIGWVASGQWQFGWSQLVGGSWLVTIDLWQLVGAIGWQLVGHKLVGGNWLVAIGWWQLVGDNGLIHVLVS